jgi:hypothetical protein
MNPMLAALVLASSVIFSPLMSFVTIYPDGMCPKGSTGIPVTYCEDNGDYWSELGVSCHSAAKFHSLPICGCWDNSHRFMMDDTGSCKIPKGWPIGPVQKP